MVNSVVEWYRPDARRAAPGPLADAVCAIAFDGLRVRRQPPSGGAAPPGDGPPSPLRT
jgi:hypothetical protein